MSNDGGPNDMEAGVYPMRFVLRHYSVIRHFPYFAFR
jgi:hypothetical protein